MNQIVNLSTIRQDLNREMKVTIMCSTATFPTPHTVVLYRVNPYLKKEKEWLYGQLSDIITPDKKYLIQILKMARVGLLLEKDQSQIRSSLVQAEYTDPMNLIDGYYDLPFLSAQHEKLKTSLHRLNEAIGQLNVELLIRASNKEIRYNDEEYCCFQLTDDRKALSVVKRYNKKIDTSSKTNSLPF